MLYSVKGGFIMVVALFQMIISIIVFLCGLYQLCYTVFFGEFLVIVSVIIYCIFTGIFLVKSSVKCINSLPKTWLKVLVSLLTTGAMLVATKLLFFGNAVDYVICFAYGCILLVTIIESV
jgi:hypothetical protein